MPIISVRIEWDQPDDPQWLNAYNIEVALGAYCRNTAFSVSEIIDKTSDDAYRRRIELAEERYRETIRKHL